MSFRASFVAGASSGDGIKNPIRVAFAVCAHATRGKTAKAPNFSDTSTGEGSTSMGFYNMLQGDAPYLKYLADKIASPAYPKDLKQRAKVNEMMDWLNTNFYRDWAYNLCYPQLFPNQKRRSDEAQAATIEIGQQNAKRWLKILNDHWIGPKKQYLCGDQITIADYFGAALVTLGEVVRCDFSAYPNIERWLNNVKKLPSWSQVNEEFYGLRDMIKGQSFVHV